MQKVTARRSVSKFEIIANLSTNLRDTLQKSTVNTSFDTHNAIQNNEVSLGWRHLETLRRHLVRQQSFAKCLRALSLNWTAMAIWRHFAAQRLSMLFTGQSVNFKVSLSVSTQSDTSLRNVSEMSLDFGKFCQVSPEKEVSSWQY